MSNCQWWKRWYHARLRSADLTAIWVMLIAKAETTAQARAAWDSFILQPGQEHWHCPCGLETNRIIRGVGFRVDAAEDAHD